MTDACYGGHGRCRAAGDHAGRLPSLSADGPTHRRTPHGGRDARFPARVPRRRLPRDRRAARPGHGARRRLRRRRRRPPGSPGSADSSSASTTTRRPRVDAAPRMGAQAACGSRRWTAAASGVRDRNRSTGCARRTSSSTSSRPSSTSPSWHGSPPTDGTALVITPNRPADFENPFHVSLFERTSSSRCSRLFFHDVTVHGLEGSPELHADFAQRRASGEKLLRLDPLDLRHKVPRELVRVGLRAGAPGRVPGARLVPHRHRLGSRRVAVLPHRRDRPDHARAVRGGAAAGSDVRTNV